jgi:hypothetical protein
LEDHGVEVVNPKSEEEGYVGILEYWNHGIPEEWNMGEQEL